MKKVAIVGVEGSGKTVMLAGLGDLYTYPDEEGYFLAPKNFGTAAYVADKIDRMRKGEWPVATAGDEMQGLDWTLKHGKKEVKAPPDNVCEVSFLDFAGEVYRAAYGISRSDDASLKEQVEELKQYVCGANDLIVLINLRDVITNGIRDLRVQEAMWITKSILDTALGDGSGKSRPRAAIALSQADSYAETIKACGGALGVLRRYLPHVANDYGWLDIFAVNAVDKTVLDDSGNMVPAADFTTKGLMPILKWIRGEEVSGGDRGALEDCKVPTPDEPQFADGTPGGPHLSRSDEFSRVHKAGDLKTIILPGGAKMEMIYCPSGVFMMGSPKREEGRSDDETLHRVSLNKGFWLGNYPVTQAQWKSVMGNYSSLFTNDCTVTGVSDFNQLGKWIYAISNGDTNVADRLIREVSGHFTRNWSLPSLKDATKNGLYLLRSMLCVAAAQREVESKKWWRRFCRRFDALAQSIVAGNDNKTEVSENKTAVLENQLVLFAGNDSLPVGNVSWDKCQEFVQKVNSQLNCGARLPTEAEWEYACRAGTATPYFWGGDLNGEKANCDGNYPCGTKAKGPYINKPSIVGHYPANPWGFHDMHGDVWEWCNDWYGDYPSFDVTDPTGPASGEYRVLRGGSWFNLARNCRSANRDMLASGNSDNNVGFRLCCSAGPRE